MADYRDRDVNGVVVENPHRAFVSMSSTGVATLKAVTADGNGIETIHTMGEYANAEEAQAKVDAWNDTIMQPAAASPAVYSGKVELSAAEKDEYARALDTHDKANMLGKYAPKVDDDN